MRALPVASTAQLAVLSYHSWDAPADVLRADVRALRAEGWRFVTAREACDFLHGCSRLGAARLALVTTDDGHAEDGDFREALADEGCPGVTFVNVGRMAPERFDWYRRARCEDWAVEDHGSFHRRVFVSGHVTGVYHGQKIGGLEHVGLPFGSPLLASAGELSSRRFRPNADAIALATQWARAEEEVAIDSPRWLDELCDRLCRARLAYRWHGRTYLVGTLESEDEFEQRVRHEVLEGRGLFERCLGHRPTMFAFPWWQGSAVADRELARAGYEVTLADIGRLQTAGKSPYSVPRIVMDGGMSRPATLEAIAPRGREWINLRRSMGRAAKRLMGVV